VDGRASGLLEGAGDHGATRRAAALAQGQERAGLAEGPLGPADAPAVGLSARCAGAPPGEGVAPGEPGSVTTAEAINAYVQAEAMFADPLGMARAVSAALDPANLRTIIASDRTGTDMGGTQAPQRGVASRYPGAYDVAQAGPGEEGGRGVRQAHLTPA